MAMYHKGSISQEVIFFLAVGFCGGLTTFSTFAFELMEMMKKDQWMPFLMYSVLSLGLGIALAFLGYKIFEG